MSKSIVINTCYGGFNLSDEATELYLTKAGQTPFYKNVDHFVSCYSSEPWIDGKTDGKYFSVYDFERDDPVLIEVIRELGAQASGRFAELTIVEIPDDVEWEIEEYDGTEWVREKSRTWS